MQLKDVTPIIKAILEERDKIPRTIDKERYIPNTQPYHDGNFMRGGIRKALRIIEQAPVVDAVPVMHGTWVEVKPRGWHRQGFFETAMIACSECHNVPVPHVESSHEHGGTVSCYRWLKTKHCPNCGVKMDLVEDTDADITM